MAGFNVGSIFGSLVLDNKAFILGLATAAEKVRKFSSDFIKATASLSLSGLGKGLNLALTPFTKLRDTIFSLKGLLAGLGVSLGIKELIGRANEVERTAQAYDSLTKSLGILGDVMLGKLRTGVKGTISDLDIMASTNRAILLGVVKTEDQWVELAAASRRLGMAMGRDAKDALEDISLGIGRQSRLILDNLGIIVRAEAAYERFANSLGKSVDDLTEAQKRTAFISAAMVGIRERLAALGPEAKNTASDWERFASAIDNTFSTIATAFRGSGIAVTIADWLEENQKKIYGFARFIAEWGDNIASFVASSIRKVWGKTDEILSGIRAIVTQAINLIVNMVGSMFTNLAPVFAQGAILIVKVMADAIASQNNAVGAAFRFIFGDEIDTISQKIKDLNSEISALNIQKNLGGFPVQTMRGMRVQAFTASEAASLDAQISLLQKRRDEAEKQLALVNQSRVQGAEGEAARKALFDRNTAAFSVEMSRTTEMWRAGAKQMVDDLVPIFGEAGRMVAHAFGIEDEVEALKKQGIEIGKNWEVNVLTPLLQTGKITVRPQLQPLADVVNKLADGAKKAAVSLAGGGGLFAPANQGMIILLGNSVQTASTSIRELDAWITKAKRSLAEFGVTEDELNQRLSPFVQQVDKLRIASITEGMPEGAKALSEFDSSLKDLVGRLTPEQARRVEKIREEIEKFGGMKDSAEAIKKVDEKLYQLSTSSSGVGEDLTQLGRRLQEIQQFENEAIEATGDITAAMLLYGNQLQALRNQAMSAEIERMNDVLIDADERLQAIGNGDLASKLSKIEREFQKQRKEIEAAGLSADELKEKYDELKKIEVNITFKTKYEEMKKATDDIRAEMDKLGMDEVDAAIFDLQRKFGEFQKTSDYMLLSPEQKVLLQEQLSQQIDLTKQIDSWKAWSSITKNTSQSFLSGIYSALERGERGWKVWSSAMNDVFRAQFEKSIDMATTYLSGALGNLFKSLGAGSGLAGVAGGLIAVGGLVLQSLNAKKSATVDDFSQAINSSEAIRGVVAGPTNVAISKVGDSFKGALRTSEGYLQRIAEAVERGTGIGGGGGQSVTIPASLMPASTT